MGDKWKNIQKIFRDGRIKKAYWVLLKVGRAYTVFKTLHPILDINGYPIIYIKSSYKEKYNFQKPKLIVDEEIEGKIRVLDTVRKKLPKFFHFYFDEDRRPIVSAVPLDKQPIKTGATMRLIFDKNKIKFLGRNSSRVIRF